MLIFYTENILFSKEMFGAKEYQNLISVKKMLSVSFIRIFF